MDKIKVAVIGVGSLGQHHARNYRENPNCELIAVVDSDENRAKEIAKANKTNAVTDIDQILDDVDAVSVVVPTIYHFEIASKLLKQGKHVLVEKPITSTVEEAHQLVDIAHENNKILQVGHIERFNAPFLKIREVINKPAFIEAHRLGPFAARVQDIGVVMDLMIHDLDIILEIVRSPVVSIDAIGVSVFTKFEDIANARINFKNGCIANLTASRVTPKKQRKIRIFQEDTYISIDSARPSLEVYRKIEIEDAKPGEVPAEIVRKRMRLEKKEPLKVEIEHFLGCIKENTQPQVSGAKGRDALQLAVEITEQIRSKPYNTPSELIKT